jgi:uncharacterized membrane protein
MILVFIAVGALLGLLLTEMWLMTMLFGELRWLAVVTGAVLGGVSTIVYQQGRRLANLEQRFAESSGEAPADSKPSQTDTRAAAAPAPSQTSIRVPPAPVEEQAPPEPTVASPSVEPRKPAPPPDQPPSPPPWTAPKKTPAEPPAWQPLLNWFVTGNIPVKIGVMVSFIGIAALLRYVAEQGWLLVPIEARLLAVAALGVVALVFGWRQRGRRRTFALAIQGGAIGVLLLTIFAAFRLYAVLPAGLAFGLMAVLVAAGGVLAMVQHSMALAILAMIAGFAAPILLADDQGNHIALFSWYAVLNLAVFGLAWYRRWPMLNRLAFGFTFVIATVWGVLAWTPEHYASTQAFLVLFFLLFFLIPILNARRQEDTSPPVDVILVFGLPLLAFPLQMALVQGDRISIAFSALIASAIYLSGALVLLRHWRIQSLGQAHAVLAVGLATLAVPFAFAGPTVTLIWALEGAALVWYGCLQQSRLSRWAGLALQVLAAGAWLLSHAFNWNWQGPEIINELLLGGLAISIAGALTIWRYSVAGAKAWWINLLMLWTVVFWTINGLTEIQRQLDPASRPDAQVAFWALTALLSGLVHSRREWPVTGLMPSIALFFCALLVFAQMHHAWPLAGWGAAAWLLVIVTALVLDRRQFQSESNWRIWTTLSAHAAVITMLCATGLHLAASVWQLGDGWQWLVGALPILALGAWIMNRRPPPLCLAPVEPALRSALAAVVILAVLLGLLSSLSAAGASDPLPWLPLINPLELGQLCALLLVIAASRIDLKPHFPLPVALAAATGWLVITVMGLRAVHQMAGVDWQLAALFDSRLAQSTLSVVWTVLGVIAWVIGSKRSLPKLWWAGAILLAMVLVKLLVIDRQFLSTVAGIFSFLAFGGMAILVGYLAPAPPSTNKPRETSE